MTLGPFDDLREERRKRLADQQARTLAARNSRPAATAAPPKQDDIFPHLPAGEPFTLDTLFPGADPNIAPNPANNPALDEPQEEEDLPFGARSLGNFFSAVSRGDTSGIDLGGPFDFLEKPLEAVAKPFALVGQGTLKVLETSSAIGKVGASNLVNSFQALMPGMQ